MIKKALLPTKAYTFDNVLSKLEVGDIFKYPTKREDIIEKLEIGDFIFIRIQGPGHITHIGKLEKLMGNSGDRVLHLKITKILKNPISAKEFYFNIGIKAGAEHGWIEKGIEKWLDT